MNRMAGITIWPKFIIHPSGTPWKQIGYKRCFGKTLSYGNYAQYLSNA